MRDVAAHLPPVPGVYCIWLWNGAAYVGKTLVSIRARVRHHIRAAERRGYSQRVHKAISAHGIKDVCVVATAPADRHAEIAELEEREISHLKDKGIRLYNLTDGGDGKPGFKWSDSTRKRILSSMAKTWTPERRNAARERAADPEYKSAVSQAIQDSWTTERKEAQRERMRKNAPARKLTIDDVHDIAERLKAGASCASIGRIYAVTPEAISAIKTGKNWSYVTGF